MLAGGQHASVLNHRYNVEPDIKKPDLPEHHLVLQDFVLEKPRAGEANVCRRRYDRTGQSCDEHRLLEWHMGQRFFCGKQRASVAHAQCSFMEPGGRHVFPAFEISAFENDVSA